MKKVYLLAIICIAIVSCNNDDQTAVNSNATNKKKEVLDFPSYEMMDKKIDEITSIKEKMENTTSQKYTSKNFLNKSSNTKFNILEELKKYHTDRLKDIYQLRNDLNFISIQSIADEINSLKVIDPIKANELFKKHQKFLESNEFEITTIFENQTSNVINENGQILINSIPINFKNSDSKNLTGKYLYDENIQTGLVAMKGYENLNFVVRYNTGREKHKDDFGRVFFRYFSELQGFLVDSNNMSAFCPAIFTMSNNSIAGFSQSGDNPFAEFAFSMPYPSGSGFMIRNTSDQKWTAYQTEGGYIKGTAVFGDITVSCDFKYTK
jgi:hypothetical protein